jgi:mannose-6-phosphate isomerase-like protein (cupin superfamily)
VRIIRKQDVSEPFSGELGEKIYEMIGRPREIGGSSNHSFVHVVIPPGMSSPAHFHKESEETYYGIAGRGCMQINERRFFVETGVAVLIMPGEIHQIWNAESDEDFEFLTISAPAWVPTDTYPAGLPTATSDENVAS